ncbi:spore germination protein [Paenibacillus cineris]|uniref:Spore germination protein n=1 Tax=Paenibacillus cineris TaxID=237530 RepID=A0ABQ4LA56_9BACL|nr:spore germination protein [Paenibacillus cineris]GIO53456.1 spore germination protein [Paenibacillus cineris]
MTDTENKHNMPQGSNEPAEDQKSEGHPHGDKRDQDHEKSGDQGKRRDHSSEDPSSEESGQENGAPLDDTEDDNEDNSGSEHDKDKRNDEDAEHGKGKSRKENTDNETSEDGQTDDNKSQKDQKDDNPSEDPTLWNFSKLNDLFAKSADIKVQMHRLSKSNPYSEIVLVFADGLCESSQIGKVILPELYDMYEKDGLPSKKGELLAGKLPLSALKHNAPSSEVEEAVFQGSVVLFLPHTNELYTMDISSMPKRTPEESTTEISVKGPKDGFTEDISTNVALIRKRLRSTTLCNETFIMGRRTRTRVSLLYIDDIISPKLLEEVKKRMSKIDMDGLYTASQLEELLSDSKYSLLPLIDFTGRPDYAVSSLINGRFVIIVDGNPMALTGPGSLSLLMKSPEDIHFNYIYVSFVRLIRVLSLVLSVALPGFWVAMTAFHQDQLPYRMLATISVTRLGLPFSAQMELFLLLLLFEIFREAGIRLPTTIGQTLTVIGGLIIGDAAIRAGLVSPSSVVVGAITTVTGATLVNQSLTSVISVIRFTLFLIASFLGMYGLILGLILLLIYVSRLRTFGESYLAPVSPFRFKDFINSVIRLPWDKVKSRTSFLNPQDPDHQGESPT